MDLLLPLTFAVGLWWLSTILLLWRMRMASGSFAVTMSLATLTAVVAMTGFWFSLERDTVIGAYIAFSSAVGLWAWHETSYYLGYVTGPRPRPCPAGVSQWQRFVFGVRASLYHELAIIATAVALLWLSADAANKIAAQAFTVMWLMRWSTKLNLFFGVSNLHENFWPDRLRYLTSYMRERSGSAFFLISAVLVVALAFWIGQPLLGGFIGDFTAAGALLVLTLLGLACLEHLFLMLPISDEFLWRWGLGAPAAAGAKHLDTTPEHRTTQ
ncbi:MAG: putative photosynthetic complex assembly protein PuhE [Pseudomonadota bacterium]